MQLISSFSTSAAVPARVRMRGSPIVARAFGSRAAAAAQHKLQFWSHRRRGQLNTPAAVPPFKSEDPNGGGGAERNRGSASSDPVIQRAAAEARQTPPAVQGGTRTETQTGLVFQPMGEEVSPLVADLDAQLMDPAATPGFSARRSMARSGYPMNLEAAFNEQINVELTMSYIYLAMYSFFSRDDVGLPGFAAYFRQNSDEERHHARLLIDYQTQRGGRVKLMPLAPPETEYWHPEKGDALHATELALSLEKLNFTKLRELHDVASSAGDADATHFLEDHLLHEQSKDVKAAAVLVSRVHRAGRGHGVFHIDSMLSEEYGKEDGIV